MISLTESAANKIRSLQQENGVENEYMRLSVEPGGCSGMEYAMSFASRDDEDEVIESRCPSYSRCCESYISEGNRGAFRRWFDGKGFEEFETRMQNTCGCGRSFS